jgi:hypothetical protein
MHSRMVTPMTTAVPLPASAGLGIRRDDSQSEQDQGDLRQ